MLGTGEIIVILVLILLLFGGKKLPEFARHLGQGIREFKNACDGNCSDKGDTFTCCKKRELLDKQPPETPIE
jgi:sec-independent protein translocase protein TatA